MRSGMRYSISFDPRTPGVTEVGRLLAPRLIGQAAFQLNFIAVTNLAWRTGEQSVSALNYAWQLLMLPHGVLALSVSTVILPTLSRLWQSGDTAAFRATLGNALRPLLFLSLPAAVVLFVFRLPIVQTLFQTGAFSAESTSLVAAPLTFLAAGLVSYALVEALTRAFYAMHDTRTPVIAGIGIVALNIVIGVALLDRIGYLALALALSLSTTVEAVVLIVVLGRRIGNVTVKTRDWLLRVIALVRRHGSGRGRASGSAHRGDHAGKRPQASADCCFSRRSRCRRGGLPRLRLDAPHPRADRYPRSSGPAYPAVASTRAPRAPLTALAAPGESIGLLAVGYTPPLATGGRTTLANERRHFNGHREGSQLFDHRPHRSRQIDPRRSAAGTNWHRLASAR